MNWISRRSWWCRSGIRTARCGEVGRSGRRVLPLLGFSPPAFPLPQGGGNGAGVGVLSAVRHAGLVLRRAGFSSPAFPLPQGSGDGASVGVLSAVRHTVLVLRWAGAAWCFLGGPCQARVGEPGAVRWVLVVLVAPQLGSAVTARGGLLVVFVVPQLRPVASSRGGRGGRLCFSLAPGGRVWVLPPVGFSFMRSVSRRGGGPASHLPRDLAGLVPRQPQLGNACPPWGRT